MKLKEFALWLQGFTDLNQGNPTKGQLDIIKAKFNDCLKDAGDIPKDLSKACNEDKPAIYSGNAGGLHDELSFVDYVLRMKE